MYMKTWIWNAPEHGRESTLLLRNDNKLKNYSPIMYMKTWIWNAPEHGREST
jgi:hypothetical protein